MVSSYIYIYMDAMLSFLFRLSAKSLYIVVIVSSWFSSVLRRLVQESRTGEFGCILSGFM